MPDVRSVSLGFWVGTGSVDEAPAQSGASHFLEHLLFKGTPTRSAREIAEAVDAVGGDMNAFTTKEYTAFYVRLLADDQDLGLDILSDIIWSPGVPPRRVRIRAPGHPRRDPDARRRAGRPGPRRAGRRPVSRTTRWAGRSSGEQVTVEAMSVDDVAAFHAAHYRPANMVVAAAGLLDHDRGRRGLAARLAGRTGGSPPSRRRPRRRPSRCREWCCRARPSRPTWPWRRRLLTATTRTATPCRSSSTSSGGGMSSRLFQSIREERGLAYSVYAYRLAFQGAGRPGRVRRHRAGQHRRGPGSHSRRVRARVAADGLTAAELDNARGHIRGSMALGLEDTGARMSRIGHSQLVHGRVLTLDEVDARLAGLDLDHVNEVAARWLSGPRTVACVGPFDPDGVTGPR